MVVVAPSPRAGHDAAIKGYGAPPVGDTIHEHTLTHVHAHTVVRPNESLEHADSIVVHAEQQLINVCLLELYKGRGQGVTFWFSKK